MPTLSISSCCTTLTTPTPTAVAIASAFGLGLDNRQRVRLFDNLKVAIEPGQIALITGPSGCGKSTLLRIIKRHLGRCVDLGAIRLRNDTLLPDHFNLPLERALYYLSLAGLADAFLFLRRPDELSDGQRYRFRLALALARKPQFIIADEFLNNLDRLTAAVIACNVHKAANRHAIGFLLASTRDDLIKTLKPDIVAEKPFDQPWRLASHH